MTDESDSKQEKPTWQEIQERKINMVKERGSRVLKINSPLGSTLFNILRQFDMAYTHFKARLGEMNGISHEEGEKLMVEGQPGFTSLCIHPLNPPSPGRASPPARARLFFLKKSPRAYGPQGLK